MPEPPTPRPAAFLDRDGTLIIERDYLREAEGVELLPGAGAGLRALREAGYALVLVTNQSGIARGHYALPDFQIVQARVEELLAEQGVQLDGVYVCPHHPDYTGPCDCRKPAPGLYLRAAAELGLDPAASLYIGDKLSDVLPAARFGGTGILVRTGYGQAQQAGAPPGVVVMDGIGDIVAWLGRRKAAAAEDLPST
jgi:D-glycero-D-manno-heptose 1,7-bisphosphate phosphatase